MQNQLITAATQADNEERALLAAYIGQLENNIEWWKEQAAIYKTQKELAQSKVSFLEMKVLQLQHIILQNDRTE
jgi:hypothetical protein